jgi:ABC-2 type transport system permease protein
MTQPATTPAAGREGTSPAPTTSSVLGTVWWVLVRSIATKTRLAGLGLLGLAAVVLGLAVHLAHPDSRPDAAWSIVDSYGLSILVPIVALVFGSAALGDLTEDGTLVYLWLRPFPRWQLAVAAFAASVTAVVPVAVLPLVIGAAISGGGARLVTAAAAGGTLAAVAYSAVFCGLGLRVRRALAWGVVYLIIWEQAVARVSHGAARASLFIHTRSLAAHLAGQPAPRNAVAWSTGLIFPLIVTVVALALTTWSLNRGEVA